MTSLNIKKYFFLFFLIFSPFLTFAQNDSNNEYAKKISDLEAASLNFMLVLLFVLGLTILIGFLQLKRANQKLGSQNHLIHIQSRELTHKNNELAHKNEDFIKQNIALERIDQEKNKLIEFISNDLKRQFTRILGLTELLRLETQSILDESQTEYLQKINEVVQESVKTIQHLLESKENAEINKKVNIERVDVEEVILKVIRRYKPYAQAKRVKIQYLNISDEVEFRTDDFFLTRILDHLLANAIKYSTFDQNIYIILSATPFVFRVEVKDEATKNQSPQDNTLGLATIQSIVEELNGRFIIENEDAKEDGRENSYIVELLKASGQK
jgi:signal transduction histidine kinase